MTSTETAVEVSKELIDLMRPMITAIPDAEAGSGEEILMRLLKARTIEGLEEVFKGRELPLDVPIIITDLAKAPSDFAGGLGFYLVMNCITPHNGEQAVYNTGSGNIIGQLLALHAGDQLPVRAIARKNDKPTRDGFYPQRLHEITLERTAGADKAKAGAAKAK